MIPEVSVAVVTTYIAAGIAMALRGPLARKRKQAAFGTALMFAVSGQGTSRNKISAFKAIVFLGIVFFWPAFLIDDWRTTRAMSRRTAENEKRNPWRGWTFARISRDCYLWCPDCKTKHRVTASNRQYYGSVTGYQCDACGKFATREYEEPFSKEPRFGPRVDIDDLALEFRPYRIEFAQGKISFIERKMREDPKEQWGQSLEAELRRYSDELSRVPAAELAQVGKMRSEANVVYEAGLQCECGGTFTRDNVLFCPGCRTTKFEHGGFIGNDCNLRLE